MVEFAYHSTKSETTGISPFEANYGMLPKQSWEPLNKTPYINPASNTDNYCLERDFWTIRVFVPPLLLFRLCRASSRVRFLRRFRFSSLRWAFLDCWRLCSLFAFFCRRISLLVVVLIVGFRFGLVWVKIFTCESPVPNFRYGL